MSEFKIDLLDATGRRIADGPLTTVTALVDTRSLDLIGALAFSLPAQDERGAYITAGTLFDVFDAVDGYLGRFYYKSKTLSANAQGEMQLHIECRDQLEELKRMNVYFRRTYTNEAVEAVVAELVALAGWTTVCDTGIGNTTVAYEGDSVLLALDVLRDRWDKHYRLGAASVLEFGSFGDTSELVLTNLQGQVQTAFQENKNIAVIDSIQLVEESDEIYNEIVALGAGQGVAQLTMQDATLGAYAVEVGTNADGSLYYFIEDIASITAYGRRVKILIFPTIRPITNSDANIVNASNALKLAAEVYLTQHLRPRIVYSVSARGVRLPLFVGDTVRLRYRGIVDNYAPIDVDELFYITDITRRREVNGTRVTNLVISTVAERRTSDTDVVIEVINDLRALKINVPITLTRPTVGPYIARLDLSHTAIFTIRIGLEVTFLNYAIMRFKTGFLKSSVTAVAAAPSSAGTGGPSSVTSSGASSATTTGDGGSLTSGAGSSHTHTVSNHQHNVDTNAHVHTFQIFDVASLTGTPVYFNETLHQLNSTLVSGTDVATSLAGAGGATTSDAGGGQTSSADTTHTHSVGNHTHNMPHTHNIEHTHDVTIPEHTHALAYGVYEDVVLPQDISIIINGTDRTIELSGGIGPFAPTSGPYEPVEIELDITEYLVNAVGGVRQNHTVEFEAGIGHGEIEFECDLLLSIQAIAVS